MSLPSKSFPANIDPVVGLIVTHWILGTLFGIFCALLLFAFDVGGLRSLLMTSDMGPVGLLLLCSGFGITFGGVVCASAVMLVPGPDRD